MYLIDILVPLQEERGLVHPRGSVDLCNQPVANMTLCWRM